MTAARALVRLTVPTGHGERLTAPPREGWAEVARLNATRTTRWAFSVGGVPARALRKLARDEVLAAARAFTGRLGITVADKPIDEDRPIFMTGHQPELVHPGIWMKNFLVELCADEAGGVGVNLVVDTDGFERLEARTPRMSPTLSVFGNLLAAAAPGAAYVTTPAPSAAVLRRFRADGLAALGTLPSPALSRHFSEFCDALDAALPNAEDVAVLVTHARRHYEARIGTSYLEVPVSHVARTASYTRFAADIALAAPRFAQAYNGALHGFRALHRTRSAAQPFPDLRVQGDLVELPFWTFDGYGRRHPVFARAEADAVILCAHCGEGPEAELTLPEPIARLPKDPSGAAIALRGGALLAPKALALTLFHRLFVSDLFVHGVGGTRYDEVTDNLVRAYYGVEPPTFAAASLTMFLPLGAPVVHHAEVEAAERRLERLRHNPDGMLDDEDVELEADDEPRARALAEEKRGLLAAIQVEGADKKALGARIRAVNEALGALLAPALVDFEAELDHLRAARAATDLVTDRSYPFCFWHPREILDKAR